MCSLGCKFEKSVNCIDWLDSLQILSVVVAKKRDTPFVYQYVLGCFNVVHLVKFFFRQITSVDTGIVLDEVFEDRLARLEFFV